MKRDVLLLSLFAALLFFISLGARDLWNPNEPTYGQAVQEMAERGDWVVPTVGGKVFPEKPILYFWMALAASGLFGGVSEFTLRLPLAVAGVLSVVLIYLLAYPYTGRFRARLTAALYATVFMVHWGARSVQMDFLVTVSTLAVVLAVTRVIDRGLSPYVGWSLAGLAAGLGFAAKGPVTLVLPAATLLLYLGGTRRLRALRTPALLAGLGVFVIVASPWFLILLAQGRTELLTEVLYRQNFVRYVEAWDHHGEWWYYLYYFWIDMAPWAWFVPLAFALPDRDDGQRRLDRLAWSWIFAVLLFFSLSQSKRSAYMLPMAPGVAILAAALGERLWNGTLPRRRRRATLGLLALAIILLSGAAVYLQVRVGREYPGLAWHARAVTVLLLAGGVATLGGLLVRSRANRAAPAAFYATVLGLYLFGSAVVLPAVDAYKSPRAFTEQVNRLVSGEDSLASYAFWDWRAGYSFYAGRSIPNLKTIEELQSYWDGKRRVFLILQDNRLDEARAVLGPVEPLVETRVGGKTAYLFANR